MTWISEFDETLERANVSAVQFRELVARLLKNGAICRADSARERELYDCAFRAEDILIDFLDILGIQVFHERNLRYFRVYPPGANPPVLPEDTSDLRVFTQRLTQDEIALLLTLRFLYDKGLSSGEIDDLGEVAVTPEEIITALSQILDRSLPEVAADRRRLLRRMIDWKVLCADLSDEVMSKDEDDRVMTVRPMIETLVGRDVLETILKGAAESEEGDSDGLGDNEEEVSVGAA